MDAHKFLIGIFTDVRNCFLFRLTGIFTCSISPEKASINVISAPFPTLVRESRGGVGARWDLEHSNTFPTLLTLGVVRQQRGEI